MDEKTLLTKLAVYEVAVKVYSNLLTNSTKALEQAQQDMSTYIPASAKCHCCAHAQRKWDKQGHISDFCRDCLHDHRSKWKWRYHDETEK